MRLHSSESEQHDSFDIAISDKPQRNINIPLTHRLSVLGHNSDTDYKMEVSADFWKTVPPDLKIILEGAVKDTIDYSIELHHSLNIKR